MMERTGWKAKGSARLGTALKLDKVCVCVRVCTCMHVWGSVGEGAGL